MATLHHGTTRRRAERIIAVGPDPDFVEPGGLEKTEGFSTSLPGGPFPVGEPKDYARRKAAAFPTEGGPVILVVEVPDDIVARAADDDLLPLTQGVVQFDIGAGLEELRAAWPSLPKQILELDPP